MRTGLVGLGEIGQHHARAIRACADADLVAICDLDAELVESTREGGEAGFTDLARMLAASELEALDVCLPHSLHLEAAAAATAAGCHVLLEKPMAIDVAACDVLIEAAAAAAVRIAVSHNQLFYEPHRRLIAAAADGSLGELRQIYARLWIGDRYRGWRERPEIVGGGLLMDAGVHRVYLLRAIGGPVTGVTAMMDVPRAEEAFTVWLEFATGATGVIQGSYFAPGGVFDDRVDAVGTAGWRRSRAARPTSRATCATFPSCVCGWATSGGTRRSSTRGTLHYAHRWARPSARLRAARSRRWTRPRRVRQSP